MTIFIKLDSVGANAGPFMVYSNTDGYITAYGVQISKANLLVGVNVIVPDGTTGIKIRSNGRCTNDIVVAVPSVPTTSTTTTTSTTSTTSTSTTTTAGPTTTTTTATPTTTTTSTSTTTSTTTSTSTSSTSTTTTTTATPPATATLTFNNYTVDTGSSQGTYFWTLSSPLSIGVDIQNCSVQGFNSSDCSGIPVTTATLGTNICNIPTGITGGFGNGAALPCAPGVNSWKRIDYVVVNGTGCYDGQVVNIGGTNVTIVIDLITCTSPLVCI
jgi:hypothetical protein